MHVLPGPRALVSVSPGRRTRVVSCPRPMFSTRLPASLAPTPLAAAVAADGAPRAARGPDAVQSYDGRVRISGNAGHRLVERRRAPLRPRAARPALARARRSPAGTPRSARPCRRDRLVLTASTSEAYSLLFKLLCDPGDRVLVPCPSYPLFEHLAQLDAVARRPLHVPRRRALDARRGRARARRSRRARAPSSSVAPNNPTGTCRRARMGGDRRRLPPPRARADRRRGVCGLSARRRPLAMTACDARRCRRPDVPAERAVEAGRPAAGQAGVDLVVAGPETPRDAARSTRWR